MSKATSPTVSGAIKARTDAAAKLAALEDRDGQLVALARRAEAERQERESLRPALASRSLLQGDAAATEDLTALDRTARQADCDAQNLNAARAALEKERRAAAAALADADTALAQARRDEAAMEAVRLHGPSIDSALASVANHLRSLRALDALGDDVARLLASPHAMGALLHCHAPELARTLDAPGASAARPLSAQLAEWLRVPASDPA